LNSHHGVKGAFIDQMKGIMNSNRSKSHLKIKESIVNHLIKRYDLDGPECVRYLDSPDYDEGAIECYGRMPNSDQIGWFFVGYEDEIN
jgi:hypothetical protein